MATKNERQTTYLAIFAHAVGEPPLRFITITASSRQSAAREIMEQYEVDEVQLFTLPANAVEPVRFRRQTVTEVRVLPVSDS